MGDTNVHQFISYNLVLFVGLFLPRAINLIYMDSMSLPPYNDTHTFTFFIPTTALNQWLSIAKLMTIIINMMCSLRELLHYILTKFNISYYTTVVVTVVEV